MGGAIKVIVRFGDGEVHARVRGTNALPFWINHPRFIDGDESLMREYVAMDHQFLRDPDRSLVPVEYGLFAMDYVTRTIVSANDYSDCRQLGIDEVRRIWIRFDAPDDGHGLDAFAEALRKGYLRLVEREDPILAHRRRRGADIPPFVPGTVDLSDVTPRDWDGRVYEPYSEYSRTNQRKPDRQGRTTWDLEVLYPGWTFENPGNGREPDVQDRAREILRGLGFPLSAEDDRLYAEWKAERARYAAEEGDGDGREGGVEDWETLDPPA